MATIAPFRGVRYDPDAVGDLSRVVAPPYDVISDAGRGALEEASPHNIVRLILGRDEPGDDDSTNKYTRARGLLEAWMAAGVLRRDEEPALYIYEERFTLDGEERTQRGILGAVGLEGDSTALPHENTYDDIVADRLELLRATESNLDCIFGVTDALDAAAHQAVDIAVAGTPLADFVTDDGIHHRMWSLSDPAGIDAVARAVAKATMVIADGHHRYRTARAYGVERRSTEGPGAWDAQLMFVADATRSGPALLPIHRVVSGVDTAHALERLATAFRLEPADLSDPEALAADVVKRRIYGRAFALVTSTGAWILTSNDGVAEREAMPEEFSPAWRDLDVAVLHRFVLDGLLGATEAGYRHSATEVAESVASGEASLGFLLAAPPFDAVRAVAETGEAMPQKSTFFTPKPATGLVLRMLDDEDAVSS